MKNKESNEFNQVLKGKSAAQLRELAIKFCGVSRLDAMKLDTNQLLHRLTAGPSRNPLLERELRKADVSIQPSFYVMVLAPKGNNQLSLEQAEERILRHFMEKDRKRKRTEVPAYKDFNIEESIEHPGGELEFQISWQHALWYWEPVTVARQHIYEFRFGFAILDFAGRKAIIACQSEQERKDISSALCAVYPITLNPIVLTRPLLDQIGTFDHLKRAGYFIADPGEDAPANITYADPKLSSKVMASGEEKNPRSQRKYSFYVIPLESIQDTGVGASTDSGKLWIPREVPLDSVRQYGMALLRKISTTLDDMTRIGDYEQVIESLGIRKLPWARTVRTEALRKHVETLIMEITQMLLKGALERAFTPQVSLVTEGTPDLFEYPQLLLTADGGENAYWRNPARSSQLIKPRLEQGELRLEGWPYGETVDLSFLRHPITDEKVNVEDPLGNLYLTPAPKLQKILLEVVEHISQQIPALREVRCIPFYLLGNLIHLDVERAFGKGKGDWVEVTLLPEDVDQMREAMRNPPAAGKAREQLRKELIRLGEKCSHMQDARCEACAGNRNRPDLCLRSLVADHLVKPLIQAHKGIELSDIEGGVTLGGRLHKTFGFAKLAMGKGGLTARNKNGAILLAQVVGQVDRKGFDIVTVISPSTINEDLRERLQVQCGVFNKRLLLLDEDALGRLLTAYRFDHPNAGVIHANPRSRKAATAKTKPTLPA
jgi:hypothetical protein